MKTILATIALLGLMFVHTPLRALEGPAQRSITVSGEAEVKVAPDEVILTLGVESRHKDLREVKRLNDLRIKQVLSALQATGVAAKDIQTDYLNLQPEYDYQARQRIFIDYVQRTTIVVTLRDVAKFDPLLTAVLQAGVEYIHGVDFRTSDLRKHRDQARVLAIKAAREKAVALADVLGQKVGQPRSIQEGGGGWSSSYGGWWGRGSQGMSQNVSQSVPGAGSGQDGPLAPGTLSVRASVSITFELQ